MSSLYPYQMHLANCYQPVSGSWSTPIAPLCHVNPRHLMKPPLKAEIELSNGRSTSETKEAVKTGSLGGGLGMILEAIMGANLVTTNNSK